MPNRSTSSAPQMIPLKIQWPKRCWILHLTLLEKWGRELLAEFSKNLKQKEKWGNKWL